MIKKVKKEALTTAHYALLYEADPSKKMVEDYITRGICFDYQTEELQGILVLLPTHPRTLEIVNIAVSEESRGRGIGQELLHFAIDFAKKEKYDYLEIGTGSTGFQQLYLYQKVGFRMTHYGKRLAFKGYGSLTVTFKLKKQHFLYRKCCFLMPKNW